MNQITSCFKLYSKSYIVPLLRIEGIIDSLTYYNVNKQLNFCEKKIGKNMRPALVLVIDSPDIGGCYQSAAQITNKVQEFQKKFKLKLITLSNCYAFQLAFEIYKLGQIQLSKKETLFGYNIQNLDEIQKLSQNEKRELSFSQLDSIINSHSFLSKYIQHVPYQKTQPTNNIRNCLNSNIFYGSQVKSLITVNELENDIPNILGIQNEIKLYDIQRIENYSFQQQLSRLNRKLKQTSNIKLDFFNNFIIKEVIPQFCPFLYQNLQQKC